MSVWKRTRVNLVCMENGLWIELGGCVSYAETVQSVHAWTTWRKRYTFLRCISFSMNIGFFLSRYCVQITVSLVNNSCSIIMWDKHALSVLDKSLSIGWSSSDSCTRRYNKSMYNSHTNEIQYYDADVLDENKHFIPSVPIHTKRHISIYWGSPSYFIYYQYNNQLFLVSVKKSEN